MVGSVKAVADANHVVAAIVFVVAYEYVQFFVQRDIVDVAKTGCEHVQVSSVPTAT